MSMVAISLHTGSAENTYQWRSVDNRSGNFASTGTATQKKVAMAVSIMNAGFSGTSQLIVNGGGEASSDRALNSLVPQHPALTLTAIAALT